MYEILLKIQREQHRKDDVSSEGTMRRYLSKIPQEEEKKEKNNATTASVELFNRIM